METILTAEKGQLPEKWQTKVNLAAVEIGAKILKASDEFFGRAANLLTSADAIFIPGKFDEHGKWVDGWETRRKRHQGHDWVIIELGVEGSITGFDVDTSFFTGNYPGSCKIEAGNKNNSGEIEWQVLIEPTSLAGNQHHYLHVTAEKTYQYVKLHIYPDGGVAKLRVYGQPIFDKSKIQQETTNFALMKYGAQVVAFSNAHFSHPNQMLLEQPAQNMGEGWETARRREPGFDWSIIRLADAIEPSRVEIDTAFFKGNFPYKISIQYAYLPEELATQFLVADSIYWQDFITETPLKGDFNHVFEAFLYTGKINYLRLNIIPDGGISRLRVFAKTGSK